MKISTTEDLFATLGHPAFTFLVRHVGTQANAAQICEVSGFTICRWMERFPSPPPLGLRVAHRSWRASWFGYPAPLPALDRICEHLSGKDLFHLTMEKEQVGPTELWSQWRAHGMNASQFFSPGEFLSASRQVKIPPTSFRRVCGQIDWPENWSRLDRLSRKVVGLGWPEFVADFENFGDSFSPAPIPGLRRLFWPTYRKFLFGRVGYRGDGGTLGGAQ